MDIRFRQTQIAQRHQRGAAAVEFALAGLFVFFPLMLALVDAGRAFFLYNTMQEITRRGAREATIRWIDKTSTIQNLALFGGNTVPGAPEITTSNVVIEYLNSTSDTPISSFPTSPGDNMSACADVTRTAQCIDRVRVSLVGVKYHSLFGIPDITLPTSTVILHAESLGFND
jgi:Flp pilus assembly protein TadG